ncbi:MAG: glycosyltransferase [Candidatus Acidiferrales bacterium]
MMEAAIQPPDLKVAALTQGKVSRLRLGQHLRMLKNEGITVHEFVSSFGAYPPPQKAARPLWAVLEVVSRVTDILATHRYDVTFLQRELLSTCLTLEPFTKGPCVFDVDDSIWLNQRGKGIEKLASICECIICGNEYIRSWASIYCADCILVPTAVDCRLFQPFDECHPKSIRRIIGWFGQPANLVYVHEIEKALAIVMRERPHVIFRVVSSRRPNLPSIPQERIEYIPWTPESEVSAIQQMDIGLMPLRDDEWCRGKCSYKMLLYMACGIPVVVAPFGMNAEVLALGKCGLGAADPDEWVDALKMILDNEDEAAAMGRAGRKIVTEYFSTDVIAPVLARTLKKVAGRP